jgi:hypothetical protein
VNISQPKLRSEKLDDDDDDDDDDDNNNNATRMYGAQNLIQIPPFVFFDIRR